MNSLILLVAYLAMPDAGESPSPQDSADLEKIATQLRSYLSPMVDEARIQVYLSKLSQAIQGASASRASLIMKSLPNAIEYHRERVLAHQDTISELSSRLATNAAPARAQIIAELTAEGFDIQFNYLATRISRAAKSEHFENQPGVILNQIAGLHDTVREVLEQKLIGEPAKKYIASEIGTLSESLKASLADPLQAFLDAPLAPEELQSIISQIRHSAADFQPLLLGEDALRSEEKMSALGISKLLLDVQKALYSAGRFCYKEYEPHEARDREWSIRMDEEVARYVESLPAITLRDFPPIDEKTILEGARPTPRRVSGPSRLKEKVTANESARSSSPRPPPMTQRPARSDERPAQRSMPLILLALGAVILLLLLTTLILSRRGKNTNTSATGDAAGRY